MADLLTRTRSKRKGESLFNRPAIVNSSHNRRAVEAGYVRPLLERLRSSIEQQLAIAAAIACLFLPSAPSTVFGRVRSVIIRPIQGVAFGPSTHVRNEQREISPFFADGYSAAAVTWVRGVIRIRAAINHQSPNSIFGSSGITMCPADIAKRITLKTSATQSLPFSVRNQSPCGQLDKGSALAATKPENGLFLCYLNDS